MSTATTPTENVYLLTTKERVRFEGQFRDLGPVGGFVTGEQCRNFFLLSQLPTKTLGLIWTLADRDADGKMTVEEFLIACKLISVAVRGHEIPAQLPPQLLASLKLPMPAMTSAAAVAPAAAAAAPVMQPVPAQVSQPPLVPPQPPTVASASMSQPLPSMTNAIHQSTPLVQPNPKPPSLSLQPLQPLPAQPPLPPPPSPMNNMPIQSQPLPMSAQKQQSGMCSAPYMSPVAQIAPPLKTVASVPAIIGNIPSRSPSVDKSAPPTYSDWVVPQANIVKYTQIFRAADKQQTGYLNAQQAKDILVQSKLPHNILSQIWTLSDLDVDGRLSLEEFIIAVYLCERAKSGQMPPHVLPSEMIPQSFRKAKTRHASISNEGMSASSSSSSPMYQTKEHESTTSLNLTSMSSFEDKRKENYEKGQAELERRRKSIKEAQRKENEERERKEREEIEKRERARLEAERKRQIELEAQLREKEELERAREEERRKQLEQKELAKKEMERQRQLELENQRIMDLQKQKEKEQENILKLKAKNQTTTIELSQVNEQLKSVSQKICETRINVNNVKTIIDGMRKTRDTQNSESAQLKVKLKEQNAKLLTLTQEKAKIEARAKLNDNKEAAIKTLAEKIEELSKEVEAKSSDIEANEKQLVEIKNQISEFKNKCENLYKSYADKRNEVMQKKDARKFDSYSSAWGSTNESTSDWPVGESAWSATTAASTASPVGQAQATSSTVVTKYRALYEFVARTVDELSFQPGDVIHVPSDMKGEPGWLYGESLDRKGWFPESYVEPIDSAPAALEPIQPTQLEGIDEVSESASDVNEAPEKSRDPIAESIVSEPVAAGDSASSEYYVASYRYQSSEQGDLNFNAGDVILVTKKEGEWWTGKLNNETGIFPSNYVQKLEQQLVESMRLSDSSKDAGSVAADAAASDFEVSEINKSQKSASGGSGSGSGSGNIPDFDNMSYTTQTGKGKKPEIASVIAPYEATSSEQLSLQKGQLVMIRKKTDSGWWEGELQAKGRKKQIGWFPSTYVKVLSSSGRSSGRTTPVLSSKVFHETVIDKVVALYSYKAANPDELSFTKGDILSVTSKDEETWWRGELNGLSGLFPSNYVGPLKFENETFFKKRTEHLNEFVSTEQTYVDDLCVLHRIFEKPLRENRTISQHDIDCVFLNLYDVLQSNRKFLKALLNRQQLNQDLYGDLFGDYIPKMQCYIKFCSNQTTSLNHLEYLMSSSLAFREQLRKIQNNPITKGLPLNAYLIKPMQRITKYPLLIRKILEYTQSTDSDYNALSEALQKVEQFCQDINENVRLTDNLHKLNWIQKHVSFGSIAINLSSETNCLGARKLIYYGLLNKAKSGKQLICFLFNDFLMLAQPLVKPFGNKASLFQKANGIVLKLYKNTIPIESLSIAKNETNCDPSTIEFRHNGAVACRLQTSNNNETVSWHKMVGEAKAEFARLTKKATRTDKGSNSSSYGRLLVNVSRAKFAKKCNSDVFCQLRLDANQVLKTEALPIGENTPSEFQITWNHSMQFLVQSLNDMLTIEIFEKQLYSPNILLDRTSLRLETIANDLAKRKVSLERCLKCDFSNCELLIRIDLRIFN